MTVPHTATHTVRAIIEQHFNRFYFEEVITAQRPYRFAHVDEVRCIEARAMLDAGHGPLILSMRNPIDNIYSHLRRGKELDHWWRGWWTRLWQMAEFDPVWIPCDTPDRDDYLARAGERLGVEFRPEWTPKGVWQKDKKWPTRGMSVAEAVEFLRQFPFKRFGYEL